INGKYIPVNSLKTECKGAESSADDPTVERCVLSGEEGKPSYQVIFTTDRAESGDPITVSINGLSKWIEKGHDPKKLRLWLAGHIIGGEPTLIQVQQGYVNFMLDRSSEADRARWVQILNEARRHPDRHIPISVGLEDELKPLPSYQFIRLNVYPWF